MTFNIGELNSAIEQFKMMLIVNPADAESRTNLACSYALLGDYEKALIEFEESFKLANDLFKAIILIDEAMVYLKRKMYGPAADALNKAVEITPGLDKVDDFSGFHSICIGLANGSIVSREDQSFSL